MLARLILECERLTWYNQYCGCSKNSGGPSNMGLYFHNIMLLYNIRGPCQILPLKIHIMVALWFPIFIDGKEVAIGLPIIKRLIQAQFMLSPKFYFNPRVVFSSNLLNNYAAASFWNCSQTSVESVPGQVESLFRICAKQDFGSSHLLLQFSRNPTRNPTKSHYWATNIVFPL